MPGAENNERVTQRAQIAIVAVDRHAVGNHRHDIERVEKRGVYVLRPLSRDRGDRAPLAREAVLDVQRLPRTLLLRLAKAERELPGHAVDCLVDVAGRTAADVEHAESDRPTDGRVRAPAGAEAAAAAIHVEHLAQRTIDDEHGAYRIGRGLHAEQVEPGIGERAQRRDHDRKIGREAACHHRVDRNFFRGRRAAFRRHHCDKLARLHICGVEHRTHCRLRRRNHRQAVGVAALVHVAEHGAEVVRDLQSG